MGIGLSLLNLIIKGQKPDVCLLGNMPGTEIYLDISRYKGVSDKISQLIPFLINLLFQAREIENIKIFKYSGCINFACHDHFKNKLYSMVGYETITEFGDKEQTRFQEDLNSVIVDLSCVPYVDVTGMHTLKRIVEEMQKDNIEVLLVTAAPPIFEQLKKCERGNSFSLEFQIFPTVHDAVRYSYQKDISINVMYESL